MTIGKSLSEEASRGFSLFFVILWGALRFIIRMYRFLLVLIFGAVACLAKGQVNVDQVIRIGQNTMWLEDYVLSIQYFNQAIAAKPYLAQPYFLRAVAKLNLDDLRGAEADATKALDRNPYLTDAWEVRGVARQNLGLNAEAVADYDHALENNPYSRALLYNKAMAQTELKEYQAADSTFGRLLRYHPNFEGGYIGRARLSLAATDTAAALKDLARALELNPQNVNARLIRADIALNSTKDYQAALADMDQAIRLQPNEAGFYVNRAYVRYRLDDYRGAMDDFDRAIDLDPLNRAALFNRSMLCAEVRDFNRAIDDLTRVLDLDNDDYRALYNRALIYRELGDTRNALADLDRLISRFPDFAAAYFLRYDVKRSAGMRNAQPDFDKSVALAKTRLHMSQDKFVEATERSDDPGSETQEQVEARFKQLLTVSDNARPEEIYDNKNIKGRVQDRNINIELEPMFTVSYYTAPTELRPGSEYIKEVADLNDLRALRFQAQVTNRPPSSTDSDIFDIHYGSISDYTAWLATHTPRAIDYFGRAMDYFTLRDYEHAIADLSRAIEMTPDFTLAYLMRGIARFSLPPSDAPAGTPAGLGVRAAIDDFDSSIALSPQMAVAYYNKGVVLASLADYSAAIEAFDRAINLKPDMGEAYYNRGWVELRIGRRSEGLADLSKAGELGVVASYNLLKRMSR